jgi:hypothetical protein
MYIYGILWHKIHHTHGHIWWACTVLANPNNASYCHISRAGVCFTIFFCLNILIWGQKSSGAVPFGTLFALCFLWFGISVPLVFIGES